MSRCTLAFVRLCARVPYESSRQVVIVWSIGGVSSLPHHKLIPHFPHLTPHRMTWRSLRTWCCVGCLWMRRGCRGRGLRGRVQWLHPCGRRSCPSWPRQRRPGRHLLLTPTGRRCGLARLAFIHAELVNLPLAYGQKHRVPRYRSESCGRADVALTPSQVHLLGRSYSACVLSHCLISRAVQLVVLKARREHVEGEFLELVRTMVGGGAVVVRRSHCARRTAYQHTHCRKHCLSCRCT